MLRWLARPATMIRTALVETQQVLKSRQHAATIPCSTADRLAAHVANESCSEVKSILYTTSLEEKRLAEPKPKPLGAADMRDGDSCGVLKHPVSCCRGSCSRLRCSGCWSWGGAEEDQTNSCTQKDLWMAREGWRAIVETKHAASDPKPYTLAIMA